jgi:hypothetical protein
VIKINRDSLILKKIFKMRKVSDGRKASVGSISILLTGCQVVYTNNLAFIMDTCFIHATTSVNNVK